MLDEQLGAVCDREAQRTRFTVWAPRASQLWLRCEASEGPRVAMQARENGYHVAELPGLRDGMDYWLELPGGVLRPDPASRCQPAGVHGPSRVVDLSFDWTDGAWRGLPLHEAVIYELHVGTFSPQATFARVEARLPELVELGVTAVELLPVCQFPGRRNWGYDGVSLFAVHDSYGGPRGLQQLIAACHAQGLAVVLDVVYNHFGPEGNYLAEFAPYFTNKYHTPWGPAVNFDALHSDHVRRLVLENLRYWVREFHVDGFRLDAIQMIYDNTARHVLGEIAEAVHDEGRRQGRETFVVGETNQNDVRQITPAEQGGLGLDGVWSDDFHHSLHALLTGERISVFADHGSLENLAKAYREGFVLTGQYSHFHGRRHGVPSRNVAAHCHVVCTQNHDQVGNRLYGERLTKLLDWESLKLAASAMLLSPYVPLLFMGEEYAESQPFLYFVDHQDPQLIQNVREGRVRDYRPFFEPGRAVPDPTLPETFDQSCLVWQRREQSPHREMLDLYRTLLRWRRELAPLRHLSKDTQDVRFDESRGLLRSWRWHGTEETLVLLAFGRETTDVKLESWLPAGRWQRVLDTSDNRWLGPGQLWPEEIEAAAHETARISPRSAVLLRRLD